MPDDCDDRVTPSDRHGNILPRLEAEIAASVERVKSMAMHTSRLPAIKGYSFKKIGATIEEDECKTGM